MLVFLDLAAIVVRPRFLSARLLQTSQPLSTGNSPFKHVHRYFERHWNESVKVSSFCSDCCAFHFTVLSAGGCAQNDPPPSPPLCLPHVLKCSIPLMEVSKCVPCLCLCTISKQRAANNQISQSNEVPLDWLVRQRCGHSVSKEVLGYESFSQFCFVRCYFFVVILFFICIYLFTIHPF